ncbi:MAG TPA: Asp-tRNA(Asn)/Glu-tRNA(Gln) amidotransferase subunit GatA [Gemmatimonadaceae bacterium]|nr:Asp-tRNA(Asn)/Glu-tRNA(Gln) amidotransferase subunit GatA [Gemmatimonadaceae bacterium]
MTDAVAGSAALIAASVRAGNVSARELASAALDAADRHQRRLNAFVSMDREATLAAADAAPRGGVLAGVPVAIKDNIATPFLTTSCGSRVLEGYVSPFEATAARKLREAGAVLIGKTTMDEFAMGSSTEHSAFGPARNPHDPDRVPGGSSGGSAVAVAAGVCPIALGSETGGSVRQPAAFCGVVGVKPTYGRVSRFGLVAFASSLDNVGVFGRTVDDAALALEVISGPDAAHDATSATGDVPRFRASAFDEPSPRGGAHVGDLSGVVIGRPREYFPGSLDAAMRDRCDRALDALRAAGAEVRDVSLPHTDLAIPAYYIVAPAECSANLARFDGVRYGARVTGDGLRAMYEATRSNGFGEEVTRRILLGTYVLSAGYYDAYYRKAMQARALIRADFESVFASGVHALFTPTTPTTAFPFGSMADPYDMYLSDIFTVTANLAGVPALSLPIGRVHGLPVGGQVIAPRFAEAGMLRVASALERALGADAHR